MKDYSADDVQASLDELTARLGFRAPPGLQEEFARGLHPNLLAYDKVSQAAPTLTALERYLVGATSYIHQPAHHYDIFHAMRHVKIVQLLNNALKVLTARKTPGLDDRIKKLVIEKTYDRFDSAVFEMLVAARYVERPGVHGLEFVPETPKAKTPDLRMRQHGREVFCECKKMDRSQDYALKMRGGESVHRPNAGGVSIPRNGGTRRSGVHGRAGGDQRRKDDLGLSGSHRVWNDDHRARIHGEGMAPGGLQFSHLQTPSVPRFLLDALRLPHSW